MEPRTPVSRILLKVPQNIHTNRVYKNESIIGDPSCHAPFLSPLSSVGSTSPSFCNLKTQSLRNGNIKLQSSQEVYICKREAKRADENCFMEGHPDTQNMNLQDEKARAILTCLDGKCNIRTHDNAINEFIDLWQLKQLALSPGGLIHSSIRKRAWLKIVDTNSHIFAASIERKDLTSDFLSESILTSSHAVILSNDEIDLIQGDIEKCLWNIHALVTGGKKKLNHDLKTNSNVSLYDSSEIKANIESSAQSCFTECDSYENFYCFDDMKSSCSSSRSDLSPESFSDVTQSEDSKLVSREEHSLLLNIILSVLREIPENSNTRVDEEEQRLYYFQGMYNIAAILLVTLESPSLSSLAIKKLSSSHLRDYFAPTFLNLQSAIRVVVLNLLKEVDIPLYKTLLAHGVHDPCPFVLPWISSWYANDIMKYEVICRLFDVFISGHALLPIYLAVAFLVHPWSKAKLNENRFSEKSEFISFLTTIPSRMVSTQHTDVAFKCIEEVIELGLTYIQKYPPDKIIQMSKSSSNKLILSSANHAESIASFQDPPFWTYKPFATTDWVLIQEAKLVRTSSSPTARYEKINRIISSPNEEDISFDATLPMLDINKALDASGLRESTKAIIASNRKRSRFPNHTQRKRILSSCYASFIFIIMIPILLLCMRKESIEHTQTFKNSFPSSHHRSLALTNPTTTIMNRFDFTDDSSVCILNDDPSHFYISKFSVKVPFTSHSRSESTTNSMLSFTQPNPSGEIHDSESQNFLSTRPFSCNDSWCKIPLNVKNLDHVRIFKTNPNLKQMDRFIFDIRSPSSATINLSFMLRWHRMIQNFIASARDLLHNDPECFFAFV